MHALIIEDDELIGDLERFVLIVGDEHRRDVELVVQAA